MAAASPRHRRDVAATPLRNRRDGRRDFAATPPRRRRETAATAAATSPRRRRDAAATATTTPPRRASSRPRRRYNRHYAAIDGTNRLNYQGKTLILVHTVDRAQHGHVIGYMLLSKGESEEEILTGLRILRTYIRAAHRAVLDLPPDAYSPYALLPNPPDCNWIWSPRVTQNDGAKGLRNAWVSLRENS